MDSQTMQHNRRARVMLLASGDNVVVATSPVAQGAALVDQGLTANHDTPQGHKIAIRPIQQGAPILKFETVIGYAGEDIAAGDWLHSHNIKFEAVDKDYAFAQDYIPTEILPVGERAQFMGIRRANGRVGTRNYIGLFVTVNCSATVARKIGNYFDEERMEAWENVDGVIPFIHESGCGMEMTGEPMDLLRRTLSGYIRHPNIAGAMVLSLGCERNNLAQFFEEEGLAEGKMLRTITCSTSAAPPAPSQWVRMPCARCWIKRMRCGASLVRRSTLPLACNAAARTGCRDCPPTPGWGLRRICSCATAAPRSCPRRLRSSASNTC